MQVNVFVTRETDTSKYSLLVLPYGENNAIPIELQHLQWRHLATTRMDDRLLANSEPVIRAQMDMTGYGLVSLTH